MKFIVTLLLFILGSLNCFAEPDYVYHEATTNTIGTSTLKFRDIITPDRTQAVKIGFKIEFQFYWTNAVVYYTTDGTTPSGSYGIPNGTTKVLNATFDHNFGSPVVDAVTTTIPAQPAGTTVKYIVSAWYNLGGDEIFGNGCGNAPRTFCASDNRLSSQATVFQYTVLTTARKIFTIDPPSPGVNLSGANGSCAAAGTTQPSVFNIPVSGVGTMTNINQLLLVSIGLTDCGTYIGGGFGKNLNAVQIRLMSPSGQCYGIYSGGLSTNATGTHFLNLVSSTNCLNNPNTSNDLTEGAPFLGTGNNGFFNAQYSGTPTIYSNYTGNADGTWKVIFSENSSYEPCVESIRLFFGDPNVIPQGTTGDNCSNPIVWDGSSPICANTTSMTGSTQMPGSIGGPNTNTFGTISGVTCGWNFANNNDVWIKYTATASSTCLSVSGISGTNVSLQSIVVTDANRDNDNNPCTQVARTSTNDPNWLVVSCPRPSVYTTTAGAQLNQQHCFASEIGKTYYLVVDGDGGANSKFWIWGFSYNGVLNMKENGNIIRYINRNNKTQIFISNGKLFTNVNNKKYKQDIIIYDGLGRIVYKTKRSVTGYSEYDLNPYMDYKFYIIKVLLDDELYSNFTFKIIK